MSRVVLALDVDDLTERFRRRSVPLVPTMLTEHMLRAARVLGGDATALAAAHWKPRLDIADHATPIGRLYEALVDASFELLALPAERPAARTAILARLRDLCFHDADGTPTCVLVTGDAVLARDAIDQLSPLDLRLWYPPAADADLPATQGAVALDKLFDVQAVTRVLFIDFENIAFSLAGQGYRVDPDVLAEQLTTHAREHGVLREAYAYADWQHLPPMHDSTGRLVTSEAQRIFELHDIETRYLVNVPRKNSADMRIADHVRDLLERQPPASFILATGDSDFTPVLTTLTSRGFDVVIWGVHGTTSAALARTAPVEYIQDFVPLVRADRDGEPPQPGMPTGVSPAIPAHLTDASRPSLWTKLVLVTDDTLRRQGWTWLSQARLVAELTRFREFGREENDVRQVLGQAIDRGVIIRERIPNPNPNYPDQFTWACHPNAEHPIVAAARLVPVRVLAILTYHLARMPYVAFSYLSQGIARDPELSVPWLHLDDEGRAQWINFLVGEGWIVLTKRPHHRNPNDLVSALTLPQSTTVPSVAPPHYDAPTVQPLVAHAPDPVVWQQRLDDMRLRMIVSIDSFTARSQLLWAPVITLRQRLLPFGREEAEHVLRMAQAEGEIVVHEYPNPQRPYPTRGASLQRDAPIVRQLLSERDDMIRQLAQYRQQLGTVSVDVLTGGGMSRSRAELWLSILQQERIVLPERFQPGESPQYALDLGHPVVQTAMAHAATDTAVAVVTGADPHGLQPAASTERDPLG